MAHFTTTFDSPASPATAFAYVADFSNVEAWDPTVSRSRLLTEKPVRLGSRFEVLLPIAGRELRLEYEITRYSPDRIVVLEAETEWLRSLDTIEVEPYSGGGCRVRYDADLRPFGPAYLLDLPLHLAFQLSGERSARGLEQALEELARLHD